MAHQKNRTCLLLMIVISMLWAGAMAQSSSCTNVIISMSPRLKYITGNSSPSSGCCTKLASVLRSQPQCACEVLSGGGLSLGRNINQTQATAIPSACRVQTPPIRQCNGNSPSDITRLSNTPTGQGSNTVLSTDSDSSSDAGSTKLEVPLFFFLLLASSALASTTF